MHIVKQGGYLGKEAGRRKERRREETRKGGESSETGGSLRTSLQPLETRPHRPRGPARPGPAQAGGIPPLALPPVSRLGTAPDDCATRNEVVRRGPALTPPAFVWAPTMQTQQNPQGWGTALSILNQHQEPEGFAHPTRHLLGGEQGQAPRLRLQPLEVYLLSALKPANSTWGLRPRGPWASQ